MSYAPTSCKLVKIRNYMQCFERMRIMNEDRLYGMDEDLENTQYFSISSEQESGVKKVLSVVFEALSTKGYDPVNQIVGYIMSGDPTYITNYMGARSLIMKVERDELVEEILQKYIQSNGWA